MKLPTTALYLLVLVGCPQDVVLSRGDAGHGGRANPVCSGVPCAVGEDCCYTTGECFNPGTSPLACPLPADDGGGAAPDGGGGGACAANSQCAADEYCASDGQLCLGAGHCVSVTNSCRVVCIPIAPGPGCEVCGCDGITYADGNAAECAGVRVGGGSGPCAASASYNAGAFALDGGGGPGQWIGCATNAACPGGYACCSVTGTCFDAAHSYLCEQPPDGSLWPCLTDADCAWFGGVSFCFGPGCSGPGGCIRGGPSRDDDAATSSPPDGSTVICTGVLASVCGCDDVTYTNTDCAISNGVRIAASGMCP